MAAATRKSGGGARPARKIVLLVATRKGLWTLTGDATRRIVQARGPAVSRQHRSPRGAGSARRQDAARRRAHRASRTDGVSFDRPRTDVEGSRDAARVPARERAHRRPHVLARAGPRDRAGRLVCRDLAARALPVDRWRRQLGGCRGLQRASGSQGVVRRRPGRHARRAQAPFDPDRSARPEASVYRHVERRHLRVDRSRCQTGGRSITACARISCPTRTRNSVTIRTACASIRCCPTASITRTTRASTGSTALRTAGSTSARRCRSPSARSAFRWCCIRAIPRRYGCFRWMAPASGRASRPAASRPRIAPSMAARPGSGRRRACRRRRRGGRSSVRR